MATPDLSGMREQILANVQVLWPILTKALPGAHTTPPHFDIINRATGTGTTWSTVLVSTPEHGIQGQKCALIDGPTAETLAGSLERLLDCTAQVMTKETSGLFLAPPENWAEITEGGKCDYYKIER